MLLLQKQKEHDPCPRSVSLPWLFYLINHSPIHSFLPSFFSSLPPSFLPSVSQSNTSQSVSSSVSQSVSLLFTQSVSQSVIQSAIQLVSQSVSYPSTIWSICHSSYSQLLDQPSNQPTNQIIEQLINHFSCLTSVYVACVQSTASRVAVQESQIKSPLEKHHADAVVNFLLRIACQVKLSLIVLLKKGIRSVQNVAVSE